MSMTDNLLTRTIIALTNLYGICRKDVVLEIYNSQNEDKVSDARVQALLDQRLPRWTRRISRWKTTASCMKPC